MPNAAGMAENRGGMNILANRVASSNAARRQRNATGPSAGALPALRYRAAAMPERLLFQMRNTLSG
jgi:hypothetical protein